MSERDVIVLIDERCERCGARMTVHPDYEKPYCVSWELMEGGCPPAPMPKRRSTHEPAADAR